jgi:hypothetical protein
MKKITVFVILLFLCFSSFGQVQEMEQLALDIQKLAQLKAMYQSMVNGYNTLSKGYSSVINISKGNFDLHKNYLDGLLAVSAPVKKYGKVEFIASTQDLLERENNAGYRKCVSAHVFSAAELDMRQREGFKLLDESVKQLEELLLVTTPGKLRMSDAERIAVIDRIDAAMQVLLGSVRKLNVANEEITRLRMQGERDVRTMKVLNGIKP